MRTVFRAAWEDLKKRMFEVRSRRSLPQSVIYVTLKRSRKDDEMFAYSVMGEKGALIELESSEPLSEDTPLVLFRLRERKPQYTYDAITLSDLEKATEEIESEIATISSPQT